MPKLTEYGTISINTENICNDLKGSDSLACLYALRYCAINQLDSNEVISLIRELQSSELIEWGSCKVSDCAIAALHLLNVQKYSGDDPQIIDLISTRFYTV